MNADIDDTPACRCSERLVDASRGARKSSAAATTRLASAVIALRGLRVSSPADGDRPCPRPRRSGGRCCIRVGVRRAVRASPSPAAFRSRRSRRSHSRVTARRRVPVHDADRQVSASWPLPFSVYTVVAVFAAVTGTRLALAVCHLRHRRDPVGMQSRQPTAPAGGSGRRGRRASGRT
jgi:hypothetical protein